MLLMFAALGYADGNWDLAREDLDILRMWSKYLLEYGEDPRSAALRELSEETGLVCDELIDLGEAYATPGYCSEVLHVYLALGLHQHEAHPDVGEFVNVEQYHIYDLRDMIMDGRIKDGKTIIAVMKALRVLEEREYLT